MSGLERPCPELLPTRERKSPLLGPGGFRSPTAIVLQRDFLRSATVEVGRLILFRQVSTNLELD